MGPLLPGGGIGEGGAIGVRGGERRRATRAPFAAAAAVCVPVTERKAIYNTAHTQGEKGKEALS